MEFRGCSHSLMFRPMRLLAPPIAPTLMSHTPRHWAAGAFTTTPITVGYLPRAVVMLADQIRAIVSKWTLTTLDWQPCRLLPVQLHFTCLREFKVSCMWRCADTSTCSSLPSSGYRGRPLREPCGSPPSSVVWIRKTARLLVPAPPVSLGNRRLRLRVVRFSRGQPSPLGDLVALDWAPPGSPMRRSRELSWVHGKSLGKHAPG